SASCGDAVGEIDAERPAAHVHLMGSVVERLAGAPDLEPVPVVGLNVVLVGLAWSWTLPEIPIENSRDGCGLADADGLADIAVPGLAVISAADEAFVNLLDDVDVDGGRAPLCSHLDLLAVLALGLDEQSALGGVVAAGLLDVNVLACLKSEDGH